jgi:hypothetical protein
MRGAFPELIVGLGISTMSLRAVCVHAGRVTWAREIALDDELSIEEALDELLGSVPRQPLTRVRVVAAVGPARSQLRHLRGLPPVESVTLLSALVRQDPTRFFLQNGVPVMTTDAEMLDDGTAWAGAIEKPVVDVIVNACRRQRWRAPLITPTAAVLPGVIDDERIEWLDGDVALMLTHENAELRDCRREARVTHDRADGMPLARLLPATPPFAGDAVRFADAIGAAMLGARSPLVHRSSSPGTSVVVPAWRFMLAAMCAIVAVTFAVAAPGVAAAREATRTRAELASIGTASAAAMSVERQLAGSVLLLAELSRFDRSSRSMTMTLASITRAVRPPTMLLSIHADSAGGTLVALTPRAMTLLDMLAHAPELSAPTIVGPVLPAPAVAQGPPSAVAPMAGTPNANASTSNERMEQVTVRFTWAAANAAAKGHLLNGVSR